MVSVEHTGPLAHFPAHRPSTSSISTTDERLVNSLEKCGIFIRRDLIARIGTPQVGKMTVGGRLAVPIFLPLLYLTVLAYLIWGDFRFQLVKFGCKGSILSKHAGSLGCILQHIINHLVIHGHTPEERYIHLLSVACRIFPFARMVFGRV